MEIKIPQIAIQVISRLGQELPNSLYYHSKQHTEEVIDECILLAKEDGLSARKIELLIIAAAFHDSGFLTQYEDNEEFGADNAEKEMRVDGTFSEAEIQEVRNCILSTKLKDNFTRIALSELSKYLLDADLGSLGRTDIFEKTEQLAKETKQDYNLLLSKTLTLMHAHQWLSPAAKRMRQKGKEENLRKIKELLK